MRSKTLPAPPSSSFTLSHSHTLTFSKEGSLMVCCFSLGVVLACQLFDEGCSSSLTLPVANHRLLSLLSLTIFLSFSSSASIVSAHGASSASGRGWLANAKDEGLPPSSSSAGATRQLPLALSSPLHLPSPSRHHADGEG
eukprot:2807050-Rhodomonas_salina.4